MAASWEVNSSYVRSLSRAMQRLGKNAPGLSSTTEAMLARPNDQTWWPGARLVELLESLETAHGRETVDALSIRASHDGMSLLVRPLVSVVLTFSKSRGQALFSRVDTFTAVGVRGVKASFTPEGNGGEAVFLFPEAVPAVVASVWVGMMDVAFSLARGGRLVDTKVSPTEHRYRVTFSG
ncbi:MAG: hypothetical protein JNM17_31605 [Archangium sp.]|nr:hypothetical protein [Archangium sp.]